MKAVCYTEYGPPEVIKVTDMAKPVPKKHEVLIKIHASTVTVEEPRVRDFKYSPEIPFTIWLLGRIIIGIRKPRHPIMGFELAGVVVEVGRSVTRFKTGDPVYGYTGISLGAHAEYKCMPEKGVITRKPANLTFAETASVPNGFLTALIFLRNKGRIKKGDKILINGASGSVGSAAVQLAKHFGAEVTGVCSTKNLNLVRSLGASYVIDYTKEDFTKNGCTYDIIFDTANKSSLARCRNSLTRRGRYLVTSFHMKNYPAMIRELLFGSKKILTAASNFYWRPEDLDFLRSLFEAEKIKPVVDRSFPLEQAADAHRYVESGKKNGNVVLTVIPDGNL